jgi:hypothetical protein
VTPDAPRDLLGNDWTETERRLVEALHALEALLGGDLAPAVRANLEEARAALRLAAEDLCLL